jgi:glycosyltransferase involved in cell wall biosynthesis
MNKKQKITVVISAFNEEKKIAECITSVKFADEIIVINNSSTDKTEEIAKKNGAIVIRRDNNPMLNVNKNFGFTKATNEWILNLDADERATPELVSEIEKIINQENACDGYYIPRKNIIFGKFIEHTGWYPDYQLRLFKNGKGKFAEEHVHEMITITGEVKRLDSPMVHFNYETISQFVSKTMFIYAPNEAEQLIKNGYELSWRDCITLPLKEFLSRFFARQGYKDGFHGLMLSLLMSFYHLVVFALVWEKEKFPKFENINMLFETEKELKKSQKELLFWYTHEKIQNSKNSLEKLKHKIKGIF